MYCHKCGKQLLPDADFCSYCGTKTPFHSEQIQDDSQGEAVDEKSTSSDLEEPHITDSIELNDSDEGETDDDNKESGTFLGKVIYIVITLIALAFVKAIAKSVVRDQNTLRVLSYAVPGLLFGIFMGVISFIILFKCSNITQLSQHKLPSKSLI